MTYGDGVSDEMLLPLSTFTNLLQKSNRDRCEAFGAFWDLSVEDGVVSTLRKPPR